MKKVDIGVKVKIKHVIRAERPLTKLIRFFTEHEVVYELLEDLHFTLSDGTKVVVPKGFQTDLRSIPKFLHSFMSVTPTTLKAYILHDWLYKEDYKRDELGDKKAKEFADKEMLYQASLIDPKIDKDSKIAYWGVKWFGGRVFKRRKEDKIEQ